ncbi:lactose-binding lectin l-2-like [Conger conger]|uniref:lactose-binding lectin l-2-like n=1 Tax=Conger conger TaxID=82655 RepID=UPI002A5A0BF0|nr:lactose-binding lectin l-2-like [Conger conger]
MTLEEDEENFCPPGWTPNDLRCFKYISEKKSWADPEMNCLLLGGKLASVCCEEDQKFQVELQKHSGTIEPFWIGLSDVHKEGTWLWSDGTAVYYRNSASGEPSNLNEEDCVVTAQRPKKTNLSYDGFHHE